MRYLRLVLVLVLAVLAQAGCRSAQPRADHPALVGAHTVVALSRLPLVTGGGTLSSGASSQP